MQNLKVVCAIIFKENSILAAKRQATGHHGGLWEFPGGKIDAGESPHDALHREIKEELDVPLKILESWKVSLYQSANISIELIPFVAEITHGEPKCLEHQEIRWVYPDELKSLDWAPADLPIVDQVIARFRDHPSDSR